MTSATAAGTLLAADASERTLTYRLLPYGEPGRTNMGRMTASRGVLTIPDRLVANLEHDDQRPVAWADRADITETDDGLQAKFHVAETTVGNDLLVEARSGLRAGVSVEVDPIVVRAGRIVSGTLNGAGFVTKPAFASAQLVASDAGEMTEDADDTENEQEPETSDEDDDTEQEATVAENTETEATMATAPAGGLAASRGAAAARKAGPSIHELVGLMASAHKAGGPRGLQAALNDVVPADILGIEQPQYVNELWDGVGYQRRFVPLFNSAPLTSYTVSGWRWVTKPSVGPYTGNKTAVPSNAIETEQITISAERLAGAHDIDRKFRDFNDTEFFNAYFRAMAESYARQSDLSVIADALGASTVVTPGSVPTDVAAGLSYIVDGALDILSNLDVLPTFALVAPSLWRDMVLSPTDNGLEFLTTALGLDSGSLEGFKILPTAQAPVNGVLVGVKSAMTVHELGGSPIRVDAVDIANGGIDEGLFGYYANNVHDAAGLVTVATP